MNARLRRRALQALRHRGWAVLLLLLGLGSAGIVAASPASATAAALGICDPEAPLPDFPGSGLPGFFMDKGTLTPSGVSSPADPYHLYNDSGFSGLSSSTYDLGCSANPENWGKTISAMSDTGLGNKAVSVGQSATALADAVDTRAWNPQWIISVLGSFVDKVMETVEVRIVAPFFVVGLLLASVILVYRSRLGDVATVAGGVAWAVLTVIVVAFIIAGPLRVATTAQAVGGAGVSALHGDTTGQPGRAATEQVMNSVHYQGWLRRTFGSSNSETAKMYGPQLLAASRITRDEYNRTDPGRTTADGKRLSGSQREEALEARKDLLEAKAKAYESIAAKIKDEDPGAYKYVQGLGATNTGLGIVEGAFASIAAVFRLAVDLLLMLCTVILVVLAIVWVVAAGFIATPWGESLGRGLLNSTARAGAYVLLAALGSWLFGLWTQVSLSPAVPAWWSMLLLALGTVVFWSLIRPDRKALSLITMGRMHGHSGTMRRVALMAGGGWALGKIGAIAGATKDRARTEAAATRAEMHPDPADAERARAFRLGYGPTPDPYGHPEPVQRDAYDVTGAPRTAPVPVRPASSVPVYNPPGYDARRPPYGTPPPPPAGASGDEDVYRAPERTTVRETP